MTTKGKEIAPGKEKRGTAPSPSNLHRTVNPTNRKPIAKPQSSTRPNTPDKDQSTKPSPESQSSTRPNTPDKDQSTKTSEKHVPNYLKSTISSSRVDQQATLRHAVKNPGNDESQKKPSLIRRNSFDKPPSSPSRVQKPLGSMSFRERSSTSHSPLSVFHKPTTSKKPVVKTVYRAVKSQPSPVLETKIDNDHEVVHEALNTEKTPELEVEEKEETLMNDELLPPETEEYVDNITDDDSKTHYEDDKEKVQPCDISSVSEEEKNTSPIDESMMATNTHGEEAVSVDPHVEEDIKEEKQEIENTTQAEVENEEPKVETESIHKESEGKFITENINKDSEGESSTDQTPKLEETDEVKDKKEEPKIEVKSVQIMKRQTSTKKGNAPAYNDVIEETKNKLMEKRKNKVSALVGAFETVISMEETDV